MRQQQGSREGLRNLIAKLKERAMEFYQYVKKTGRVVKSSYICNTKTNK